MTACQLGHFLRNHSVTGAVHPHIGSGWTAAMNMAWNNMFKRLDDQVESTCQVLPTVTVYFQSSAFGKCQRLKLPIALQLQVESIHSAYDSQ